MPWLIIACVALPAYACAAAILIGVWCVYRDVRMAITHMYVSAFETKRGHKYGRECGYKRSHAHTHTCERTHSHTCEHDPDDLLCIANGTYASRSAAAEVAARLSTPAGRQHALRAFAKKTGSDGIVSSRIADTLIDVASTYILRDLQANTLSS